MPVSFLDLIPALPTVIVTVNTRAGPAELELTGISLEALAEIAKRYPSFRPIIEGELGNMMDDPDMMAAVIAASLGHLGDPDCERRIKSFSAVDAARMVSEIVKITWQQPDPLAGSTPPPVVGNGQAQTSPSALNN